MFLTLFLIFAVLASKGKEERTVKERFESRQEKGGELISTVKDQDYTVLRKKAHVCLDSDQPRTPRRSNNTQYALAQRGRSDQQKLCSACYTQMSSRQSTRLSLFCFM